MHLISNNNGRCKVDARDHCWFAVRRMLARLGASMLRLSHAQLYFALLLLTSSCAIAQTSSAMTEVKLKQPIDRTIAAGEVHR